MPANNDCYLVDASIYVFRAWHTLPDDLTSPQGHPINALLGFTDFVFRLLNEQQPEHIAFAFDGSLTSSCRNEIYPEYKANRPPAPEELKHQFKLCREFLRHLGLPELISSRFEADDLIGALAEQAQTNGQRVIILTADKDLTQLIGPDDIWWNYAQNNQLSWRGVEKKFGVRPDQIADLLAIAGDKVDNIPGVPGVGMATAARLLKRFDNIDNLLGQIEQISDMKIRGAKRVQSLINEHQSAIQLAQKLTRIFSQEASPEICSPIRNIADENALTDFMQRTGFSPARQQRWIKLIMKHKTNTKPDRNALSF